MLCICLSYSGFLDKNNDLLNRNLKEVRMMKKRVWSFAKAIKNLCVSCHC